jgi:tripartite-type tricarboxylate transporter receptor subunit TctC
MFTRRGLLAAASTVLLAGTVDAAAQDWPQRPIRVVVPFGPGGGSDIVGRIIAQSMQERLGQPVVIENGRAPAACWAMKPSPAPTRTATRSAS